MKKLCDLHTHTVFSDGTFTPEELVDEAVRVGLSAVALTDHNTVCGLDRFMTYGKGSPVETVAGIEFTTSYKGRELHILGLFVPADSYDAVTRYVKRADELKEISNIDLAKNLNAGGYKIDYEKLKAQSPGKINRAHFAAELFRLGYADSVAHAFKTILSKEAGFYNAPERLPTLETIEFIRRIGAAAVWAHPLIHMTRAEFSEFLPVAKAHGLRGTETIYSLYSDDDTAFAKAECKKNGLLESGGSDFHGTTKPDISLGRGKGNLEIPYGFFEKLRAAI